MTTSIHSNTGHHPADPTSATGRPAGLTLVRTVGLIYTIVYLVLAVMVTAAGLPGLQIVILTAAACLFGLGTALTGSSPGAARVVLTVAGVLGLPLGIGMVVAAQKLKG